jgi:phage-related protein (TIGR01555 family)
VKAKGKSPKRSMSRIAVDSAPQRMPAVAENVWVVAEPPPGVVPADAPRLACDDLYTNAAASPYMAGLGVYAGYYAFPGFPYLAALAQQTEYRQGFETVAREMTRKWIKFKCASGKKKAGKLKKLEAAMKRHKVQHKVRRLLELDGNFGRAHLYIDTGVPDADRSIPLIDDARVVGKGKLKELVVVEPMWCYPAEYNSTDPTKKNFYVPTMWYVMQVRVHATRLITIVSSPVPDLLKPAYSFGGVSLVQRMQVAVNNFTRTRQSVSDITHSFSTMVLETDTSSAFNGGNGTDLTYRVQMFNNYRDNSGCFVVNATGPGSNGVGEKLYNVAAPLGTLDALQAQAQEQQAPVIGCPLVVLLGYTPAGLNASAEDQIRVWYDRIHANQENTLPDCLDRIITLLQLSEFGAVDPDITWDFVPLFQLDEAGLAAVEKTRAETHAIYANDIGAVDPTTVREVVACDEASPYHGLDLEGDAPGPPPEPANEDDPSSEGDVPGEPKREEVSGV